MAGEPDWVPPGVDTKRANAARIYDYLLGGSHNFLADQDVARALAAVEPNVRLFARANREFLGRAVRFLSEAGIRQFLDIGSGIPTEGNVHRSPSGPTRAPGSSTPTSTRSRSRIARPSWPGTRTPRSSRPTCAIRRRSSPTRPPSG